MDGSCDCGPLKVFLLSPFSAGDRSEKKLYVVDLRNHVWQCSVLKIGIMYFGMAGPLFFYELCINFFIYELSSVSVLWERGKKSVSPVISVASDSRYQLQHHTITTAVQFPSETFEQCSFYWKTWNISTIPKSASERQSSTWTKENDWEVGSPVS